MASIRDDIEEIRAQQVLLGRKMDKLHDSVSKTLVDNAVVKEQASSMSGQIKIIWSLIIAGVGAILSSIFKVH